MFDPYLFTKWLHIIGACVLFGTGAGIAFFMVQAHKTKCPLVIAHTASTVVLADLLFTTTAVLIQPVTGVILANQTGWSIWDGWIFWSLLLYVFTGLFWLPVVWIQLKMRNIAKDVSRNGSELPEDYFKLYKIWFVCGFPAFLAVMAILWLMLAKPNLWTPF